MFPRKGFLSVACLMWLIVLFVGCGDGGGIDRPKTAKVSGTVTLDGNPLESVTVSFVPDGVGRTASGITDSSGNYTLTTIDKDDGAIPGNYKIMVSPAPVSDAELDKLKEANKLAPTESSSTTVPKKYRDVKTSDLTATVSESGSTVPLKLESGG